MLAASYWSLLSPAIELAQASGLYGNLTFLPIALGFAAGAVFVYVADLLLAIMVWLSLPHSLIDVTVCDCRVCRIMGRTLSEGESQGLVIAPVGGGLIQQAV